MNRRESIYSITALGLLLNSIPNRCFSSFASDNLTKSHFGDDFLWGVATAAYQIEGAINEAGKSPSIWDTFSHTKGKIKTGENGDIACSFYHKYKEDLDRVKQLNFDVFRFSLAWTRIVPNGFGKPNQKGIDFYHRIIDACLERGIQPWVTLYHWDLPQILEDKGGWKNRDIVNWFSEYTHTCAKAYGDKVKNWMILNEPVASSVLGYLLGIHAPGKRGFHHLYPVIHHTTLCQAEGTRIIKNHVDHANVGSTFSYSPIHPKSERGRHQKIAGKLDALLNRLFIEPALGMGYPIDGWPLLENIYKYVKEGDEERMKVDFDFIGLQNYTRVIAEYAFYIPLLWGKQVSPKRREAEITEMGWEVYPQGIYEMLKRVSKYQGADKIYITENGCAFPDSLEGNEVHDYRRIQFYKDYLAQVLRAKREGVNIKGYFCWSLMDNFEWAEGYQPRFGLVHIDYKTQQRTIKDSGLWFKKFLEE